MNTKTTSFRNPGRCWRRCGKVENPQEARCNTTTAHFRRCSSVVKFLLLLQEASKQCFTFERCTCIHSLAFSRTISRVVFSFLLVPNHLFMLAFLQSCFLTRHWTRPEIKLRTLSDTVLKFKRIGLHEKGNGTKQSQRAR